MTGECDAPLVLIRASGDVADKVPLDLSDRLLSFEYVDSEKKADQCLIDLDNFDLSLYEVEGLRTGAILTVGFGYANELSPLREVVIKRSSASSYKKPRKAKGEDKAKKTGGHGGGGNDLKGFEVFKIEAYARSILMHQKTETRVFENMRRSDVVRKIAAEHGYAGAFADIEDTGEVHAVITQARLTDAQFLKRLAEKEGFEFFTDWDGFHFHKRRLGAKPIKVFHYYNDPDQGEVLKIDELETNLAGKPGAVTVAGIDPLSKKEIRERATNATTPRDSLAPAIELVDFESVRTRRQKQNAAEHVIASPEATSASARREAEGRFRDAQLSAVKLKFTAVGDGTIVAKSVIEMRGIGRLFVGKYYLSEARHKISNGGYTTQLSCRRDGVNSGIPSLGDQNKQAAAKDELTPYEGVDLENVRTRRIEFRDTKGRTVGVPDSKTGATRPQR